MVGAEDYDLTVACALAASGAMKTTVPPIAKNRREIIR